MGVSPRPTRSRRPTADISVDLQPERFDDRCPESNVGCEGPPEFFRILVESGFDTRVDQPLLVGRSCNCRARRLRNLFEDLSLGPAGLEQPDGADTSPSL